jgi:hypothetical protein
MNFTLFKKRKQRQKPNILTVEQSQELGHLAGNKLMKNIADQGLVSFNYSLPYLEISWTFN